MSPSLYKDLIRARWVGIVTAWMVVLLACCLTNGGYFEVPNFGSPRYEHWLLGIVVLVEPLEAVIVWFDGKTLYSNPVTYWLHGLSAIASVVAHVYFVATPFVVCFADSSWFGRLVRWFSFALLLIWAYPLLQAFHPINPRSYLDSGYYVMAGAYTWAMLCVLFCPRPPNPEALNYCRSFPVIQNPPKLWPKRLPRDPK